MVASLEQLVQEWLRLDKNESTRNEIKHLWESNSHEELERRLRTRIEFGTAGLRGRMEAGFSRMNDLVIIQASQGLCAYILKTVDKAAERGVVVGHDHRHNSQRWAVLTAAAFLARGVKVYLHRGLVHTPLVPFTVSRMNAACGVMITASHNPKQDNGYKVYWENAVQIIGPHDTGIAASIIENREPDASVWDTTATINSGRCIDRTGEMKEAYFEYIYTLCSARLKNEQTSVRFVNTSMHGVSHPFVITGFQAFGFPADAVIPVGEQQEPDPDFPTVSFPNPEEKGALDLALKTAEREGALYVLAQDPDSDRFSGAEKSADGWKIFTGDQLGTIFAARVLEIWKASGKPLDKLAMVASTVSSKMIERMAEVEKFKFVECLTGFKFIGNTALKLVSDGFEVPFGYEEAIGFMFGSEVRDKDGVSATLMFAELAASLSSGSTIDSYLGALYKRYGYFLTRNSYFVCYDPPTIDRIFARLRNYDGKSAKGNPSYPKDIANLTITGVRDLTIGYDNSNPPSYKPVLPLSSGNMITFKAEDQSTGNKIVLTIRTSGTEPKIKYYLEGNGRTDPRDITVLLDKVVSELKDEWMEAVKNHLHSPA